MKLIDMSHMIEPWSKNFYQHFGARVMVDAFHTYEADGYFEQTMYMGDHTGTHVESSKHFSKNGVTIGETPLSDYYGKAVVLNFTNKKGRVDITSEEIREAASRAGVDLGKIGIVLIRTDISKLWGTREYHSNDRPSIAVEAHEWLIKQGVKTIGVDMLVTERDHLGTSPTIKPSDPERWPAHCLMKKHDFYIVENLTNLDQIPKGYFTYVGFPLNFAGGAASPIRAVAIIE